MKTLNATPATLATLLLLALGAAFSVRADSYNWVGPKPYQGGNGDFGSAQWSDSNVPAAPPENFMQGPPGGGDFAYVPENSILSGSGSVMTLDTAAAFGGGLNGSFSCQILGSVLLTGGSLTAGQITSVSGDSAEDIIVTGGNVTADSADNPAVSVSGGGSVVIKGTVPRGEGGVSGSMSLFEVDGALMNFNGGPRAGGTLTAQSIQSNNGLSGMIYCDGAGSLVSTTGTVEFDGQGAQVTNGGHFTIGGNLNLEPDPTDIGGGGSAYLDGAGTSVTVAGNVYLGPGGTTGTAANYLGNIMISDGASLQAAALTADSPQDGNGAVNLDTGATMRLSNAMIIGGNFTGTMAVLGGSSLTLSGGTLAFGLAKGSSSNVSISGSGSSLNVSNATAGVGAEAGSSGYLSLDTSATMRMTGSATNSFYIGNSGTGNLAVLSGAAVQVLGSATGFEVGSKAGSTGSVGIQSPDGLVLNGPAIIGNQGNGELSIDGTEQSSSASASGNFFVGGDGSGEASTGNGLVGVYGGAQFSVTGGLSTNIGLGNGKGAAGEIYVTGSGSTLKLTGVTIAGLNGDGELGADAGATAQSTLIQLGAAKGSTGGLLVYNPGTTWTNTTSIVVGGDSGQAGGSAGVIVLDGGLVRTYQTLSISNLGVVDLTKKFPASTAFPNPVPVTTSAPGRVFVGKDNFGPDGAIRVGTGGVLKGQGKQAGTKVLHTNVVGNVVIGIGGKFQPGGDPNVFSIEGDCDLSDSGAAKGGGETDIQIAGTGVAGTDYDQIVTTGKVTLGGTLKLVLMAGYIPKVGDTIDPIKAKSMAGAFKEAITPGLTLSPVTSAGKVSIKVTHVADVPAPDITSEKTATAQVSKPFVYQIVASGMPAGYAATGLPAGLGVDPGTGLISGMPTAAGSSSVKLTSTSVGGTGTATLDLIVKAAVTAGAPVITSAASDTTEPEVAFTYRIVATNTPTSFAATDLPGGLSLNAMTGVISGKPAKAGTYLVNLSATNAEGTGQATLKLVVALPLAKIVATIPEIAVGGGKTGEFTISIPAALKAPLTIHYKASGSAIAGTDYAKLTGTAIIKVGKTSAIIKVTPRGDLAGALTKIVKLTLEKGTGYSLGMPASAKVTIIAGE